VNPFFHLASRGWLRKRELDPLPENFSQDETSRALAALKSLRIALVKQEVLAAMPNLPGRHSIRDFLKSAGGHTGCLSLLHELGAELILVREDSSPECQTWREKVLFDTDPPLLEASYRRAAHEAPFWTPSGPRTRHKLSVAADTVDWEKFDLIVCLDIPVPGKIVRAYPRTVWAYMITETAMPSYRASRSAPLHGYDLFLNQKCRLRPVRPSNRWHEIDFPWALQTPECYGWSNSGNTPGIFLDPHTREIPPLRELEKVFGLRILAPRGISTLAWIQALRDSRYLVRLAKNRNWGNLLIEAACIGSLVLADPVFLENPAPLLKSLVARTEEDIVNLIRRLEEDPQLREQLQKRQTARIRELAFARPLRKLETKVNIIRKRKRLA
jgi:hypothetical protein